MKNNKIEYKPIDTTKIDIDPPTFNKKDDKSYKSLGDDLVPVVPIQNFMMNIPNFGAFEPVTISPKLAYMLMGGRTADVDISIGNTPFYPSGGEQEYVGKMISSEQIDGTLIINVDIIPKHGDPMLIGKMDHVFSIPITILSDNCEDNSSNPE